MWWEAGGGVEKTKGGGSTQRGTGDPILKKDGMKERVEVVGEEGWSEVEETEARHRVCRLPRVRPYAPSLALCLHQPALSPLKQLEARVLEQLRTP